MCAGQRRFEEFHINQTLGVVKFLISLGFVYAGYCRLTDLTSDDRILGGPQVSIITSMNDYPMILGKHNSVTASLRSDNSFKTFTPSQQKDFLASFGSRCTPNLNAQYSSPNPILEIYNELDAQGDVNSRRGRAQEIQRDLWKFCALGIGYASSYVDFDQVFMSVDSKKDIVGYLQNMEGSNNYAVMHNFEEVEQTESMQVIHAAVIRLGQTDSGRKVAREMIELLMGISTDALLSQNNYAMWKGLELYRLVNASMLRNSNEWILFHNQCIGLHNVGIGDRCNHHSKTGFCSRVGGAPCCQVKHEASAATKDIILLTRHGLESFEHSRSHPHSPSNSEFAHSAIEKFSAQVIESKSSEEHVRFQANGRNLSPRLFDVLLENDCLPSKACHHCLSKQDGGDQTSQCIACRKECRCYCSALCTKVIPHPMKVSRECHVKIPVVKKRPDRLIPRIVHQTYFESVTREKYPNFSRLVESWKRSGWEYNFYHDKDAEDFITAHFPPEVREAYDLLIPGAYKADLFRYCVLLIHGGVYADVDVLLSTDLDKLLEKDIGFMVPVDEPGRETGAGSCLWNGFLAAAPGHPIIAKTIEIVVNNIRNRFTAVDIDGMLCPTKATHRLPDLDLSHSYDLLYITGPCILGGALNLVMGNHIQSHIDPGELRAWNFTKEEPPEPYYSDGDNIQGRIIILGQNKNDMGSHRFTSLENNILVAATDMPGYQDRNGAKHYSDSKSEKRYVLFGMKDVFKNLTPSNEVIKLVVSNSD